MEAESLDYREASRSGVNMGRHVLVKESSGRSGWGRGICVSDCMASIRSGLFCAAFDCSNNKSVQKARDFFRFPKEQVLVVYKNQIKSNQVYLYTAYFENDSGVFTV